MNQKEFTFNTFHQTQGSHCVELIIEQTVAAVHGYRVEQALRSAVQTEVQAEVRLSESQTCSYRQFMSTVRGRQILACHNGDVMRTLVYLGTFSAEL